jgi:hypothetical protein
MARISALTVLSLLAYTFIAVRASPPLKVSREHQHG